LQSPLRNVEGEQAFHETVPRVDQSLVSQP
jgi:hypothetical protein